MNHETGCPLAINTFLDEMEEFKGRDIAIS